MSEAVTQAAYRFVETFEEYQDITAKYDLVQVAVLETDTASQSDLDEAEHQWDLAWARHSDARDALIATVLVEKRGVNLG